MKKSITCLMVVIVCTVGLVSCTSKIKSEEAAKPLAQAMCDRQKACSSGAFAMDICAKGLEMAYRAGLKYSGHSSLAKSDFDGCMKAMKIHDCVQMKNLKVPDECGFLSGKR